MARKDGKQLTTSAANARAGKSIASSDAVSQPSVGEAVESDLRAGGVLEQALPGYEERQAQIVMARELTAALDSGQHAAIEAGTGTGKALDVDTPIATRDGWKCMGDLDVGDLVFDERGQPTRVTAAFEVMHNHECYEVVFSDGSSIVADAEHEWLSHTDSDRKWAGRPRSGAYTSRTFVTPDILNRLDSLLSTCSPGSTLSVEEAYRLLHGHHWSIYQAARALTPLGPRMRPLRYPSDILLSATRARLARDLTEQRRDGRAFTLVTTGEMVRTLRVGPKGRVNHAIPVAGALALPETDLPIDAYFLGVWLGDGASNCNQIIAGDPDILPEIEKAGYTVRRLASHPMLYAVDDENGKARSRWQPCMRTRLRAAGLLKNKHIPAVYLRASESQRRAVLAGLLDTDGTVSRTGAIEFTATNPRMAHDAHEIICSLGFRPTLRCGRARLHGKDCGPKWTIAFTTDQQVFRLPRKVAAHKARLRNFTPERNSFRYVMAVQLVPSRPVRCIQVDSPSHLYLAGRSMIPTHNSLAYIIPLVRSGKIALISTANKTLQEQLYYKDIPFVQQHLQPFKAALVKGMGNYLCLDKLDEEQAFQKLVQQRSFARMEELLRNDGWDGDLDLLPDSLAPDTRARVAADSDECAWRSCSFFKDCYVRKMRERAQQAQVIVINHTLLLLDAAMDGWLLPERDVVVLDEAHHLEDEATRAFTATVSPGRVQSLLSLRRVREHASAQSVQDATAANVQAWEALAGMVDPGARGRQVLRQPLQEGLRLASYVNDVATSLVRNKPEGLDDRDEMLYDKVVKRARALAADLRIAFGVDDPEGHVYYVERGAEFGAGSGRRAPQPSVSAAPLGVGDLLAERLFGRLPVVATSATLAIGGDFSFYRGRVGLPPAPATREKVLPLAFDFREHALLYIPRLRYEPAFGAASGPYLDELAAQMRALVEASQGRAFLLFSSQRALQAVLERISGPLDDLAYSLLVQGAGMGRVELVRRFREEPRAVLFGLKSFWEGVDISGEALSLVAIDKLPFAPPDDPIQEARVNRMKASGENWFGGYTLPLAILQLKQGLGRLLRTRDDRGVMAILDTRIHTKSYGRQVLAALPPARRTADIREVERFFE